MPIKSDWPRFRSEYRLLDEIPFDFFRKRMSVLVEESRGGRYLSQKEPSRRSCRFVLRRKTDLSPRPIGISFLKPRIVLNDQGYRLIAVAFRELTPPQSQCELADEAGMCFAGFIGFLDPPTKETAPLAVKSLIEHGVAVKILTGDNERVTEKVAREVGLPIEGTLLGRDIDGMSDSELAVAAQKANLFAKLTPDQKRKIVQALRDSNHVVGFIGDGINDAPALRAADVGISVNNAVDIAKESADIILLEKSLMVLEAGIVEGKKSLR